MSHSHSRSPHSQLSRPRTITRTSTSSRVTSNISAPVVVSPTRLISLVTQIVGVLGIAMVRLRSYFAILSEHAAEGNLFGSERSSTYHHHVYLARLLSSRLRLSLIIENILPFFDPFVIEIFIKSVLSRTTHSYLFRVIDLVLIDIRRTSILILVVVSSPHAN